MTPIADLVAKMLSAGIAAELVVEAVRAIERHAQTVAAPATAAAKRRAYDRERKRKPSNGIGDASPNIETNSLQLTLNEEGREIGDTRAREEKPKSKPATRLPADWVLSDTDHAFALTLMPQPRVAQEADKFRDYWHARAGPMSVKRDWSAAWRNWCRKSVEMQANGHGYANTGRSDGRGNGLQNVIGRLRSEAGGSETPSPTFPRLLSNG